MNHARVSLLAFLFFVQLLLAPFVDAAPFRTLRLHDKVAHSKPYSDRHRTFFHQPTNQRNFSSATPGLDVQKYWLEMDLDLASEQFEVIERVDFQVMLPLNEVRFDAGPEMSIHGIQSHHVAYLSAEREKETVVLKFATPLEVGISHSVFFKYTLPMKGNAAFTNTHDENGNLILLATFTEPLLPRKWMISSDKPSDKALSEIVANVPAPWKLMSNGVLIEESMSSARTRFHWKMNQPIATYLISIAAAEYSTYSEQWKGIPLYYWYDKKAHAQTVDILKETPRMMDYFAERLIPYPFEKYALVTANHVGGAMEHTTATTMATDLFSNLEDGRLVALHELAHHWFGDTVTCKYWDDLWLNESLATFFEMDYIRATDGYDAYYNYKETITKAGYLSSETKNGSLGPIVNRLNTPDDKFNSVTYEKGGILLDMTRNLIGDEAFFAGLKNYLVDKNLYMGNAVTADFLSHLQEATDVKLDRFFQDWVFRPGYPELKVSVREDFSLFVEQTQNADVGLFYSPVVLNLIMRNDSIVKKVMWVDQASQVVQLNVPDVKAVVVDPDHLHYSLQSTIPTTQAVSLASNSKLPGHVRAQALDQLLEQRSISLNELKEYSKTQNTFIRTSVLKGLLKLYANETFTLSFIQEMISSTNEVSQNAAVQAILSVEEKLSIISGMEKFLVDQFSKTTLQNKVEYVLSYAQMLAKYQFPTAAAALKTKIAAENESVGSYYYGFLLRYYAELTGDLAIDEFAVQFQSEKNNYRGRTAWAFGFLKSEKAVRVIGQALLAEPQFKNWELDNHIGATFMINALKEIKTGKAQEYLQQFRALSTCPETLKNLIDAG